MATAFFRWLSPYGSEIIEARRTRTLSDLKSTNNNTKEMLWAMKSLARFFSCAATALVSETAFREDRQTNSNTASLRLGPYLALDYQGMPCWSIQSHCEPTKYLIVRGDSRVVDDLENVAREKKCPGLGGRPAWRRQRFPWAPTEQQSSLKQPHAGTSTPHKAIWNPEWVSPYESSLYVLVKYIRANLGRNCDWKTDVFSPKVDKPSLLTGAGVVKPLPTFLPGAAVHRGILSTYAPRWRCKLNVRDHFRFCPDCLALGYHSIFYQLVALVRCPVHGVPLVSSCTQCHESTPRCEPKWYAIDREYRCYRCVTNEPMEALPQKDWALPRSMRKFFGQKLTPLAEWLVRTERTHRLADVEALRAPIPELQLDQPRAFVWYTARLKSL